MARVRRRRHVFPRGIRRAQRGHRGRTGGTRRVCIGNSFGRTCRSIRITYEHSDRVEMVAPFNGNLEIFSVYHKPAPACNYAQTACQAALAIGVNSAEITNIEVRCTAAAIDYPGCNAAGPFQRVLQAKMSIHFCVAATLARRSIEEGNYRNLNDPEITRLMGVTKLQEDAELTKPTQARRVRSDRDVARW